MSIDGIIKNKTKPNNTTKKINNNNKTPKKQPNKKTKQPSQNNQKSLHTLYMYNSPVKKTQHL